MQVVLRRAYQQRFAMPTLKCLAQMKVPMAMLILPALSAA